LSHASLRAELRAATNPIHGELERLVGDFTHLVDYQRYVRSMHGFMLTLATSLRSSGHSAWFLKHRCEHLQADLRALQLSPLPLPSPVSLPQGSEWGARYVVEGASLGARTLVKRVAALGLSPDSGASFVNAEARDTSAWPDFLTALDTVPASLRRPVIDAALTTFNLVEGCFRFHDLPEQP